MVSSPFVAVLKVYPFNRCAVSSCNCPRGVGGGGGGGHPAVLSRGWLNRFLVEACFRLYLRGSFNENELIVFKLRFIC